MHRPRVRKLNGRWTVTRPAYGFGWPQTTPHRTWRAALRSLAPRPGTPDMLAEHAVHPVDGIAAVPVWTPMDNRRVAHGSGSYR